MQVYGRDGEKIGSVVEVWRDTPIAEQVAELGLHGAGEHVGLTDAMVANTGGPIYDATGADTGTVPLGTTMDKARGMPTTTGIAARRDISTFSGKRQGVEPGAGGEDVIRGYGPEHGGATDPTAGAGLGNAGAGLGAQGSAQSATGYLNSAGQAGTVVDFGRVPDVGEAAGGGARGGATDNAAVEPPAAAPAHPSTGGPHHIPAGYFVVSDPGFLGVGGRILYVPYTAVTSYEPRESLTVDCVSDECRRRYSSRPGLDIDPNARVLPF